MTDDMSVWSFLPAIPNVEKAGNIYEPTTSFIFSVFLCHSLT
jgi:hypothetical protein